MIMFANSSNNNSKASEDDLFPKCNLNGIVFKTIISGEKTGYEYSIVEILFPEGNLENEIPLHIQSKEIVIVYVIKGNFQITYGQQEIEAKNGMLLKLEKDIARSFKRIGNQQGELLVMYIPAGFEKFFKDISSMDIEDFKHLGIDDPILIQLLENNYGARVLFNES